jgi:hypothetical protein
MYLTKENRVLKRIFGHNRDEGREGWRKYVMKRSLICSYCLLDIVWKIKSRRIKLAGYVAHMGDIRSAYEMMDGKPK